MDAVLQTPTDVSFNADDSSTQDSNSSSNTTVVTPSVTEMDVSSIGGQQSQQSVESMDHSIVSNQSSPDNDKASSSSFSHWDLLLLLKLLLDFLPLFRFP